MARNPGVTGRVGPQAARRAFNLRFVGETVSELRRVTWPSRQETIRLTLVVLSVAAAVGIFLGLVDMGFSRLMDVILR
jgi:preprotein translocase subunit SecE